MCQKLGLYLVLIVSILVSITEARSDLKVLESPPDDAEVHRVKNGELWAGVLEGNIAGVKAAIRAGANPLSQKTFGNLIYDLSDNLTALHYASWSNNPGMVKVLLEVGGVDVNLQTSEGRTPAYFASRNGSTDALNILIEHNADINIGKNDNKTPLMIAAQEGQLTAAKILIEANASLDVTGGYHNATALYYAAKGDNRDIVSLLIKHNAAVNIPGPYGWTPLMLAAWHGHLSLAKALIRANASLDVTGGHYEATALFYAARNGNPDIVSLLIKHNADINIPTSGGFTPLMKAGMGGHLTVAETLINGNASLDVTGGSDNATALYWAAKYENPYMVSLLIKHNADVNIPSGTGNTPLMLAAQRGYLTVAKILINANASIDAIGGLSNATALHYAAWLDNPDIVSLLIKHNANVNIPASGGATPLMGAAWQGHLSLAKTLIKLNASLDVTGGWAKATALHYAAKRNHQDLVILLLRSGADTRITDPQGRTPAALARSEGYNQLADLIETYTTLFKLGLSVEI